MAPNIVILDGFTLNPGDLSWEALREVGTCTIYDRTPSTAVAERAAPAEILLTNKTPLPGQIISGLSRVKYIGVMATGYNVVDVQAARERGIPVTNVPEYGTRSVAQAAFAHLLNFTQHTAAHARAVREGRWQNSADWCFWDYPMVELEDRVLGIIGLGRIGRALAQMARGFGMRALAVSPPRPGPLPEGVVRTDLSTLFRKSDVISLHCPLLPETERIINREHLGLMKRTAFIINTSRGPLIDEQALAEALNNGRIAGAGLDVLSSEPPAGNNPLIGAQNCYITPHNAWATQRARVRLMETIVENVRAFLNGKPCNVVN